MSFESRDVNVGPPESRSIEPSLTGSSYQRVQAAAVASSLARSQYPAAYIVGSDLAPLARTLSQRCACVDVLDVSRRGFSGGAMSYRGGIDSSGLRVFESWTPEPTGDLIVLSDVGYYLERGTLALVARRIAACLQSGGELIAAHWLGDHATHPLHGDEVHMILHECLRLRCTLRSRRPNLRVDRWES